MKPAANFSRVYLPLVLAFDAGRYDVEFDCKVLDVSQVIVSDMRTGRPIHTHFEHGAARAAEIAARDMAEWFVPIGAEGLLPGAKNRDQSVPGQIGLMFLGIGSHQYIEQPIPNLRLPQSSHTRIAGYLTPR